MVLYNQNLKQFSRALRKNSTNAEIRLWSKLRLRQLNGLQFYRQRIIVNYIVDFFCPKVKLIIEVDGGQHYFGKIHDDDLKRDEYLKNLGYKVLRFSDRDVLTNIEGVVENILTNMANNV
ncbi:MAG: endonuclease domain-containing protein [Dehalococcoidales bacterium]